VEAFVAAMVEVVRKKPGTVLLPMTEATTLPLSAHRESLIAAGAQLILPEHRDLLRAFNKKETTRLAASLGIAVPTTRVLATLDEAQNAAEGMQYPLVLKPSASEELLPDGNLRTAGRPRYASDAAQCMAAFGDIRSRSSAVLVQEFVEGEGTGYFALLNHGELRAEFAHRRIRDVYPTGSGSAVRVSVPVDPEIRRDSLAILAALRWHGVAMVEYRKKGGSPAVFMEVNGRFWHSLALSCYAGVDFPALLVEMAERGDILPTEAYGSGIRCRWLLGDVRHLVEVWKGPPPGYPRSYPDKLRTLLQVLTPVPGTYHDLFQWRDPLPEIGDWLNLVRRLVK
jgi:predicted ATP-grasp superfamily ATP-dependent carboligase